jgi:hypothetical protein
VKALLGFVMNAKYARQETVGLKEMGLRLKFVEGEAGNTYENKTAEWIARRIYGTHFARLVSVRSPQDALGRRVVDDGGNVRWEGLHNPSLYDEAQRQCVVVTRFPESEEDVITLLRSCISRDGTHALAILTNDTAAGLELFAKLEKYWYENYTDLHFRVEEEEEKPDVVPVRVPAKHAQEVAREAFGVSMLIHGDDKAASMRKVRLAAAGLKVKSMEGNRRFKAAQRANAGKWLIEHNMVAQRYVPLDTLDMDNPKNEGKRFMRLGSAVLSVRGTKKTSLGHAPRGPREVGVMMDTCVPVDA